MKKQKKMKENTGITLIALVVTIVVLLILAGVTISMLGGENGIITQATKAREKNEITSIKEQAELVKSNMFIGDYASTKRISQTAQRKNLVQALNEDFEGSTASGNVITTSNNKYDIIVKNDLEILVVKHGENYLKDGEVELLYYYDEADTEQSVSVWISPMIGGIESYEEYAKKILGGKSYEEKVQIFIEGDIYWYPGDYAEIENVTLENVLETWECETVEECWQEIYDTFEEALISWGYVKPEEYYGKSYVQYAQEILDGITQTGDERIAVLEQYYIETENYLQFGEQIYTDWTSLMSYWEEQGWTTYDSLQTLAVDDCGYNSIEEFLLYEGRWIKLQEYEQYQAQLENTRMVEIQCSNGIMKTVIVGEYENFKVNENGEYTFIATAHTGKTGKVTIDIDNIVGKQPTINSITAEKTSEGLHITVDATDAANYQFKINDGEYSAVQTSTEYNYNIDLSGKSTSSTIDPYIPKGFVHTEGTVTEGYVISDFPNVTITVKAINSLGRQETIATESIVEGNEYVWIPVSNINGDGTGKIKKSDGTEVEITLGRYTFNTTTGTPTKVQYGSEYEDNVELKHDYGSEEFIELKEFRKSSNSGTAEVNETAKDLAGFISSVERNGGYYIARYEASYESGTSESNYKLASKISTSTKGSTSLTKGKLWNYIWQGTAAKVCKNMYIDNETIESDLMNSYAWDTAIIFIQMFSGNSNYANANSKTNGNLGTLKNTGETGDIVCNIYDMAGNLYEWTTEYSSYTYNDVVFPCVARGGCYDNTFSITRYRNGTSVKTNDVKFGFRPILYSNN